MSVTLLILVFALLALVLGHPYLAALCIAFVLGAVLGPRIS